MAKYQPTPEQLKEITQKREEQAKPKRTVAVRAGDCPRAPRHGAGRVYKTAGRVRYCVCDQCGHTWTKAGPLATTNGEDQASE